MNTPPLIANLLVLDRQVPGSVPAVFGEMTPVGMKEAASYALACRAGIGSQDRGWSQRLTWADGVKARVRTMITNTLTCQGLALSCANNLESMYAYLSPGARMKSVAASNTEIPVASPRGAAAPVDDLFLAAQLSLDEVRRLCQALAVELGLTPADVEVYGSWVDLIFTSTVLLRERHVLIRASLDPATPSALASVHRDATERGCADYLLVSTKPPTDESVAESEHVLGPVGFIGLCRRSAMVEWRRHVPSARRISYQAARQRADALNELDTFGLAWLPALSRNRLPWVLRDSAIPADEWFERVVFRVATMAFRVNGLRLGAASRGKRVGDALLWWRGRMVLVDCKAAYSGYRLDVDDERRLLEYAGQRHSGYGNSEAVDCVVLVSSDFPTFDAEPRRFAERRRRFREVGSNLACVRADDLIDAALMLLSVADDTRRAESVAWHRVLSQGMVTRKRLLNMCGDAVGRL